MDPQQEYSDLQEENEKLRLENVQLRKNLEKEDFFHKSLYKQWSELHALILSKEGEIKRLGATSSLHKYGFYLILFLAMPAFYLLNDGKGDERIVNATQTASLIPIPGVNETLTLKQDTVQVLNIKPEEKAPIQPGAIKPIPATINDTITNEPLVDSVRNSIYWEGWSAYYEKSRNPYRKSTQEYEAWLEGWKEGENDAKKTLAKK